MCLLHGSVVHGLEVYGPYRRMIRLNPSNLLPARSSCFRRFWRLADFGGRSLREGRIFARGSPRAVDVGRADSPPGGEVGAALPGTHGRQENLTPRTFTLQTFTPQTFTPQTLDGGLSRLKTHG